MSVSVRLTSPRGAAPRAPPPSPRETTVVLTIFLREPSGPHWEADSEVKQDITTRPFLSLRPSHVCAAGQARACVFPHSDIHRLAVLWVLTPSHSFPHLHLRAHHAVDDDKDPGRVAGRAHRVVGAPDGLAALVHADGAVGADPLDEARRAVAQPRQVA
eukprot:366498-Chlamydomonas_euryale.AAC.3